MWDAHTSGSRPYFTAQIIWHNYVRWSDVTLLNQIVYSYIKHKINADSYFPLLGRANWRVGTHLSVPVNYIVEFYTNFNSGENSFMFWIPLLVVYRNYVSCEILKLVD